MINRGELEDWVKEFENLIRVLFGWYLSKVQIKEAVERR